MTINVETGLEKYDVVQVQGGVLACQIPTLRATVMCL